MSSGKLESKNKVPDIDARISDEDIERAKKQVGISTPIRWETHSPCAEEATIRNFTWGYGDDNPLYRDAGYAAQTRWRGLIAPPTYPIATGVCDLPPLTGETKKLFRGLFPGVGKYYSGVTWEWYRPIYAGDKTYIDNWTSDVKVKSSSFSGSRSVIETWSFLHTNRAGEAVSVRHEDYVNAERGGSKKSGKFARIERQRYDDKDIAEIDDQYSAEERRGSAPRYWEDVEVGDELVPVVKGPLTVTDLICQHVGWGMGEYGPGPLKFASSMRKRMPKFFTKDEFGIPDIVQRLHWDPVWAEAIGVPAPYDYGQMRTSWMVHLLSNWMGDDAWLWKACNRLNGFNFLGDTHVLSGVVKSKTIDDNHCCVTIEVRGTSQRGVDTLTGEATIILPSKEYGEVQLPIPPIDIRNRSAQLIRKSKKNGV